MNKLFAVTAACAALLFISFSYNAAQASGQKKKETIGDYGTIRFKLMLDTSSFCLDVKNGCSGDGTPLQFYGFSSESKQIFMAQPSESKGWYYITAEHCGKYLERDTHNNVFINTKSGADTQKWKFVKKGGHQFLIVSRTDEMAIGADADEIKPYGRVVMTDSKTDRARVYCIVSGIDCFKKWIPDFLLIII